MNRTASILLAALVCTASLTATLSGCYQRGNYPEIPTSQGYAEDPNRPATEQAMVAALQYVGSRWTPGQRMYDPNVEPRGLPYVNYPCVINLPLGMRKIYYERIPGKVGPQVLPATPDNVALGLPTFHVTRVWMRFNKAYVDILRPMPEMGPGPDGTPVYQLITVHLEGGIKPWNVVYARSWPAGQVTAPEYSFVPAVDDANQFVITQREMKAKATASLTGEHYGKPSTLPPVAQQEGEVKQTEVVVQPDDLNGN